MWRHIASNALTLFIVLLFLGGGLVLWASREYEAAGPLERAICLKVNSGDTMRRVSDALGEQGAVTSPAIFRMGADYSEKTLDLKAGSFLVPERASMEEIVDIVTRGGANTCGTEVVYRIGVTRNTVLVRELDPATNRFTEVANYEPGVEPEPEIVAEVMADADTQYSVVAAEGATSWQILTGLQAVPLLTNDVSDVPPEGSLAPSSYAVREGDTISALIARMTSAQEAILAEAWANRADDLPVATPEEALILASLIEKETGVPEERRQVASVFVNRLRQGMRLQTDPTVIYGITNGEGVLGRGLRRSELRAATPWNTYVIEGLPPTPIANPGRASLMAAAQPDESDFIFFVADGTGGHAFAQTLEEHNRNVARWREIEAERGSEAAGNASTGGN